MGIITCKAASGVSEPHQSRSLEKRPGTPPILDDYEKHFSSALSSRHIYEVKKELRTNLQDDERRLLEYCLTLIRTERDEHGEEQWNNAMITVLCSERQIVLSSGLSKNKYEVWMESGNPRYKVTEREKVVAPQDFKKIISPPMKPSAIQQVLKDLRDTINDDERQLLQHCMTMIADETEKTGRRQWNDVAIMISCSRGWNIVIATGTSTTNTYEVWMDGTSPKHKMTERGWTESAWDAYSQIPSAPSMFKAILPGF